MAAYEVGNAYLTVTPKVSDGAEEELKGRMTAIGVAAGNLLANAVTNAVSAIGGELSKTFTNFADYEQLVGGVETLFKDANQAVQDNAKEAFRTAGLSANEYMETVTSFSASLISSLDGDTARAAEVADRAIVDMSDNANKMGSSMESIQNAYQGFAKQNYTMLDNLKLGYGGTKSEMERLLADASELAGVEFNIDSYADVVEAIHVIQDSMDITGTTAKEGATTISGSINMLKGSWENFLTAFGDGGRTLDFDQVTADLMESLGAVANNAIPAFARIVSSAVTQLPGMLAEAVKAVPGMLSDAIGAAFGSDEGLLGVVSKYLGGSFVGSLAVLREPLGQIADAFAKVKEAVGDSFLHVLEAVGEGFKVSLGTPATAATGVLTGVLLPAVEGVASFLQGTVVPFVEQAAAFVSEELVPRITDLATAVGDVLGAGFEAAGAVVADVLAPAFEAVAGFVVESVLPAVGELAAQAMDFLVPALEGVAAFVSEHVVPALQDFGAFVMETVVPDVQALAGWVSEHLGPVFEGMKDTLLNHVVPALSDMATFVMDNVVPAIEGMYGWFKDNILPVLKDVAEFVTDKVAPALKDVADWVIDHVVPALQDLFGWVNDSIIPVFDALAGILETVVGWLVDVANHIGGAIEGAAAFFFGDSGGGADVSWHATGGIVSEATLIGAGERGAELIWPSYEPYISKYADAIAASMGGAGGVTIEINNPVVRETADVDEILDHANRRLQRRGLAAVG